MNPFRNMPKKLYPLLLFAAAPMLYNYAFGENPTERLDCNAPKSAAEAALCEAPRNLELAQKYTLENLKIIGDFAQ